MKAPKAGSGLMGDVAAVNTHSTGGDLFVDVSPSEPEDPAMAISRPEFKDDRGCGSSEAVESMSCSKRVATIPSPAPSRKLPASGFPTFRRVARDFVCSWW